VFRDRVDAGNQLAQKCEKFRSQNVVVLGLPRGGVPVAAVVARHLDKPLDIIGVRKLGTPGQPELAMGAIGEGGVTVMNDDLLPHLDVSPEDVARVRAHEQVVLERRLDLFRSGREQISLDGVTALIVDDGIATGATASVACLVARARGAARVVLAVPVAPVDIPDNVGGADEVVVVVTPDPFIGVGMHYAVFDQTTDEEVVSLLNQQRDGG
jgi:putative phosphoribosyl transferase